MLQTLSSLDPRIVGALQDGPLTTRQLAESIGESPETLTRRRRQLKREHALVELDPLDVAILGSLSSNGSCPTSDLASELQTDHKLVYRHCCRLEEREGFLHSEKRKSDRTLLFFPATGQVLNRGNYRRVLTTVEELRRIARKYSLKHGQQIPKSVKNQLRREYREHLHELARKADETERAEIRSFERELMQVLNGTTLSDVLSMVGLRGFHPKVREWKADPKTQQLAVYVRRCVSKEPSPSGGKKDRSKGRSEDTDLWMYPPGLLPGPPVVVIVKSPYEDSALADPRKAETRRAGHGDGEDRPEERRSRRAPAQRRTAPDRRPGGRRPHGRRGPKGHKPHHPRH